MKRDEQDKSPELSALRRIVRAFLPELSFAGDLEYSVQAQDGAFVALRPTDASLKLPDLPKVPFRGAPGVAAELVGGTRVLVRFVNCDPGRPYVAAVIGADDDGFIPTNLRVDAEETLDVGQSATLVNLAGGSKPVALENLVSVALANVYNAITTAAVTANDGGAALKANIKIFLDNAGWNPGTGEPPSVAATKVKAT